MTTWVEYKKTWEKCESEEIILGNSDIQHTWEKRKFKWKKRIFFTCWFWEASEELSAKKREPSMLFLKETIFGLCLC
jgi:hypothetical protein